MTEIVSGAADGIEHPTNGDPKRARCEGGWLGDHGHRRHPPSEELTHRPKVNS